MLRRSLYVITILIYLFLQSIYSAWANPLFDQMYIRSAGAPDIYTGTFSNCEPEARYRLVVINGDNTGDQRLSSATVWLNGTIVLSPDDLNQQIDKVEKTIALNRDNTLKVVLASALEGYLKVSIECVEKCLNVEISETIIYQNSVIVKGAVKSSSKEVGVVVNAVPGQVSGPSLNFAVAGVPLGLGLNTLTATATNSCGMQTASLTEQEIQSLTDSVLILLAEPDSGIAPLTVHLKALAALPKPAANYQWNFTTETGPEASVTYELPGLYFPRVTVTDTEGSTYEAMVVLNVQDRAWLENLHLGKWISMREALDEGNVETVLSYFTYGSRDKYRQIFEAIKDKLSEESAGLQDIVPVSFRGTTAKYRIQRIQNVNGEDMTLTYWVYFVQDADGIWRIRQF
jgi:hypothetical protein